MTVVVVVMMMVMTIKMMWMMMMLVVMIRAEDAIAEVNFFHFEQLLQICHTAQWLERCSTNVKVVVMNPTHIMSDMSPR